MSKFMVALAVAVLLLATLCSAQTTKGTIAGTVTDDSGAVVQGATVTVSPKTGGEDRTTTSGSAGEYRVEALNPGPYRVSIAAPHFATQVIENVVVNVSLITSQNVVLKVGGTSETLTVEATSATVQTETGDLTGTVTATQIKDLPITSGNPYQLAITMPGVVTVGTTSGGGFTNGTAFSVDGLRPRSNNFLLDGFDNNDNGIAGQALQPTNQEAVQEVTVLRNSYSAEFGRGGSSVSNLSYKSGTNSFHGAGWEEYSGAALNALLSEEAAQGLTRPSQFVNNVFGFRFGGPIIKNKLFIFGTSQWARFFGAFAGTEITLPTASGVTALQSITGVNQSDVNLLVSTLNGIAAPSANLNPVDIGIRSGCPAASVSSVNGHCLIDRGSYTRFATAASPSREWTVRADYTPSDKDSFLFRYTDTHSSLTPDLFANGTALPSIDTQQGGPARNVGIMWSHTLSPSVLNELRFSAQTIDFEFSPTAASLANPNATMPGVSLASSFGSVPNQFFWGGVEQSTFPQGRGHKVFQLQDGVSIIKGRHSLKIGADLNHLEIKDQIAFNSNGQILVSSGGNCSAVGLATCTDLANYLDGFLGSTGTITRGFGNPRINVPTTQQAYYAQDTWKIRPNLTLDLGLRYEYQPNDYSNVLPYPAINLATVLTDPVDKRIEVKPDRNNFGPRAGIAYTPRFWRGLFGDNKTVLRMGYGIFYDAFFTNISNNTAATTPNTLGGSIGPGSGRGASDILGQVGSIVPVLDPSGLRDTVPNNLVNPKTQQWNVNIQRELPARMVFEVAYVGTRGEHLYVNQQLNPTDGDGITRLNPNDGSIIARTNAADSIYHGLQTQVTRNFGHLTLRGSYTYSKAIDNGSEVFATSGGASRWQNVFDPRSDRGPSAFDRRHRAAITWVYDLPSLHGDSMGMKVLNAVIGGWSSGGQLSFQTGAPQTIYIGGFDQNGDGEGFNDRPNMSNPAAPINYSTACFADPSCITGIGYVDQHGTLLDWNTGAPGTPNQFRYIITVNTDNPVFASGLRGNVGRNTFYNPGRQDINLSAIKRFKMPYKEGHEVEFRADLFNPFNHPNLGGSLNGSVASVSGNIDDPNFLNLDVTREGGRAITLWLKYSF